MEILKTVVLIFVARFVDVIIMTTVTLSMVNNKKIKAGVLGFIETILYAVILSRVMQELNNFFTLFSYGAAYGLGIIVAMKMEEKRSDERVNANIVIREDKKEAINDIRDMGFSVTVSDGRGRNNEKRYLLFIVLKKNRLNELESYVKENELFMSVNSATPINGYFR